MPTLSSAVSGPNCKELGWLGANTVVVVIGDGAEWIWKRAWIFPRCCEILDFWHALEHAWSFARLQYGEGSKRAERWVHQIAEDLRAGKVQKVIARLERLQPSTVEARKCLQELIATTATMPAACDTTSICV